MSASVWRQWAFGDRSSMAMSNVLGVFGKPQRPVTSLENVQPLQKSENVTLEIEQYDLQEKPPALKRVSTSQSSLKSKLDIHGNEIQRSSSHANFAGRFPAGTEQAVTVAKNGVKHIREFANGEHKEVLSVGLACSECFHGPRLAKLLREGFEYERRVLEMLEADEFAAPLSIHTSSGVPDALSTFVDELESHLPWEDAGSLDWVVSFQLEGASAVWAAIDLLMQEQMISTGNTSRKKVAVGAVSYHGPPSTSFGAKSPLWSKGYQLKYPVPLAGEPLDEEALLAEYEEFLDNHAHEIGVMLVEPQWGSSQAAMPWPKHLCRKYIRMAQERGIKVCCDEIMCGLGRHGHGTLFVSEAWDLNPDAVTFGKSVAAGVFPLSGAVLKHGRDRLHQNGKSVMQSHTFAGSSARGFMTATAVLKELPQWFQSAERMGNEMARVLGDLQRISNGILLCHGQGLMWGGLFTKEGKLSDPEYRQEVIKNFKKHCDNFGILPYHVPAGGFMVTPMMDIDAGTVRNIGEKLEKALKATMAEMN